MNEILNIILKIIIALAFTYLTPTVASWLKDKGLMQYIDVLVRAVEQVQKDTNGSSKKVYVLQQLEKLGIKITSKVDAMIEASVLNMNIEQGSEKK